MVTNVEGIFAGGDVVSGPGTVITAMRAGKTAAESIHQYLRGESLEKAYEPTKPRMEVPPVELGIDEATSLERPKIPSLTVDKRTGSFQEVELGFSKEQAINEAKRCLRCDLESKGGK
jgi:pyruvate/2-oxoglutarate dehydrogenase complex dihydrolipoamide dehydrogenase (E3) component